jgi:hypothetical protein
MVQAFVMIEVNDDNLKPFYPRVERKRARGRGPSPEGKVLQTRLIMPEE